VPQSYSEAALWCRRAANQGNSQGQYLLGLMYDKGQGVTEDFVQAYKWLNLAATRASGPKKEFSYRIRDAVATKMSPDQVTKAQQLALDWKPALEQRTK
jgi:TPR repeat protein